MKLNLSRFLVILAVAMVLGSTAHAQSVKIRAQVPFDFVLGDKVYPAGEYVIQALTDDSHGLLIRNRTTKVSTMTLSYPATSIAAAKQTALEFHRLGNTYFIYQAKFEGSPTSRQFPRSHTESKMAMMQTKPETVIVAANIIP